MFLRRTFFKRITILAAVVVLLKIQSVSQQTLHTNSSLPVESAACTRHLNVCLHLGNGGFICVKCSRSYQLLACEPCGEGIALVGKGQRIHTSGRWAHKRVDPRRSVALGAALRGLRMGSPSAAGPDVSASTGRAMTRTLDGGAIATAKGYQSPPCCSS